MAYDAGVTWLHRVDEDTTMESGLVVVHCRHLFVNGKKSLKLIGGDVERMPNNTVQISTATGDVSCIVALQNAMEAESFAGQCCAAATTFSPEKHQDVNRMQQDKKTKHRAECALQHLSTGAGKPLAGSSARLWWAFGPIFAEQSCQRRPLRGR